MCKADISFLLNPATEDRTDDEVKVVTPTSPQSMALFRSLSPIIQSPESISPSNSHNRHLVNSYISPREKRFNNTHSHSSGKTNIPVLSLAALYMSNEIFHPQTETAMVSPVRPHSRKTHTPPCQVEGCKNLAVSRGCCVRHGGGSKCTVSGCNKRAKLYQRCFQHGGHKMCTEPGCTKNLPSLVAAVCATVVDPSALYPVATSVPSCTSAASNTVATKCARSLAAPRRPSATAIAGRTVAATSVRCQSARRCRPRVVSVGHMGVVIAASMKVATVVRTRSTTTTASATHLAIWYDNFCKTL
ncbi:hypothetical protein F441_09022 [Phytophthora nicotianae CJ01A1]|uniref:WRKY transcription factor 19 n=2 Tax=Phytophthora nicotianae TaxID=4792 RepID=W2X368_PHYNI|nr:hypothetical protein F441_09022 [Phytophthora nicotianae CJ01A1]